MVFPASRSGRSAVLEGGSRVVKSSSYLPRFLKAVGHRQELLQVRTARCRIIVTIFHQRLVETEHASQLLGERGRFIGSEIR